MKILFLTENFPPETNAAAPRHTRERQAEDMLRVLHMAADGRGASAGVEPALDSSAARAS